jgi:hypothetical protein
VAAAEFQILQRGYVEAYARFRTAATPSDATEDDTFIPLFEVLNWAGSIDEHLGFPGDRELRGIRFARNRVHHQWAKALRYFPGAVLGGVGFNEAMFNEGPNWRWRRVEELPAPPARWPDPKGKRAYRDLLADRSVHDALGWLENYLASQP